jgi:hypothetical protein
MSNFYEFMPPEKYSLLSGLTIRDALYKGYIKKIGTDDNKFIFESFDNPDALYAVIDGYAIRCSQKLVDSELYKTETEDLTFFRYINSDGEEEFVLGRPKIIRLGRARF